MVTVQEAEQRILPFRVPLPWEEVPLESAAGRILREPVRADRPYPVLDRVCMDGIAIRYAGVAAGSRSFRILGMGKAGAAPELLAEADGCIEVMTGAPCPFGADTVVPVEEIRIQDGSAELSAPERVRIGRNIQTRGSDCGAGETLVHEGERLNAARIAIAASVGLTRIRVTRTPFIRILATGDEIVGRGSHPEPWQIRGSNLQAVKAMIGGLARSESRWSEDNAGDLEAKIHWGLEGSDMLVLTGGVSAGKFDLVPQALEQAGVARIFHKAAIKPGKPVWFGRGPGGIPVFGLPGNPVSCMICFRRFAMPLIQSMAGLDTGAGSSRIRLSGKTGTRPGTVLFQPVTAIRDEAGAWRAQPCPINGSGDFCGLGKSDGFVEITGDAEFLSEGDSVPYFPWES